MKKYFVGVLFGIFLLFGGMDVYALEIDQVINGINSKQYSEDLLQDMNNLKIKVSAAYNCDSSTSTCDSTTTHQFDLVFTSGADSGLNMSSITYDFTDEYISYINKTTGLGDFSLEKEIINVYGLVTIMDTIATQQGQSIPYNRDQEGLTFQYATDGLELDYEVFEDGTIAVSSTTTAKINYRDGFAGAIEKMKNAPIKKEDFEDKSSEVIPGDAKDDENNEENRKDENNQKDDFRVTPIDTGDDSEKVANPSTGDLNLPVVVSLGVVAILGVGVSFKKIYG